MELPPLTIDDVATGGDGIAHAPDGRVVFVEGAVPGDTVEVTVTREKRRHLHARVQAVVAPSADRVVPPCPHVADGCGGCSWQHIAVDAQRRLKVRLVEEALRRLGRVPGPVAPGPALPSDGFRTTVRCAVDADGRAGFRAARSHDVVAPELCLVAHPAIQELMSQSRFVGAGEVVMRTSVATGERVVQVRGGPDRAEVPAGVVVVAADAAPGEGAITEVVSGIRFRVSPSSFFQTRTDGAAALVDAVDAAVGPVAPGTRLVDLYGGVGLFAGTVGREAEVTLVEASPSAVADAEFNLPDATIVRCPVERWQPIAADVVIADPPRAGLGSRGIEVVTATGASRLVAVHCDAASLGRDAGLLSARGWTRDSATLVDLFPHTAHVEVVSAYSLR